jgi:Zn-dependent protease with chaperone function
VIVELLAALALATFGAGRAAGPLAHHPHPRFAATTLAAVAVGISGATGLLLYEFAAVGLAQVPSFARSGHWSADVIEDSLDVPAPLGTLLAALALAASLSTLAQLARSARQLAIVRRWQRERGPAPAGLIITDGEDGAPAFALPGRRGTVVVTRELLGCLDGRERRALLAHEESHLRHRHHLYVQVVALAAAANPVLRPLIGATRLATERWADEDAAVAVHDRVAVARALATAGLLRRSGAAPAAALPAAESDLAGRLRHLVRPDEGRRSPAAVAVLAGSTLLELGTAAAFAAVAHGWFEAAQAASPHR